MPQVHLYFDFISPYAALALLRAKAFASEHAITWQLKPVVYAALLDNTGLIGPAEVAAKRRYTFKDVLRAATIQGESFVFPPAHPFRSIEALRTVIAFNDSPNVLDLAVAVARAGWVEGRDLTDLSVLQNVVESVGLDSDLNGDSLAQRLGDSAVKNSLRENTQELIDRGGFGVPSFWVDGELFWGQDRLEHLAQHLRGTFADLENRAKEILSRPRAADRKSAPKGRSQESA